MSNIAEVEQSPAHIQRAKTIQADLQNMGNTMSNNSIDIGLLLAEAKEHGYNVLLGYIAFDDWLAKGSGIELSTREAYYLINVVTRAAFMGIPKERLYEIKISKLKSIFTLDPNEHEQEIRDLLDSAESSSLTEIEEKVKSHKALDPHQEPMVYMTIKFPESAKYTIEDAFELCKKLHGGIEVQGEQVDPSNGRCLELICADFLSGDHTEIKEVGIDSE